MCMCLQNNRFSCALPDFLEEHISSILAIVFAFLKAKEKLKETSQRHCNNIENIRRNDQIQRWLMSHILTWYHIMKDKSFCLKVTEKWVSFIFCIFLYCPLPTFLRKHCYYLGILGNQILLSYYHNNHFKGAISRCFFQWIFHFKALCSAF